jgi:hypothetical protein
MKYIYIVSAVLCLNFTARAQGLSCRDTHAGIDSGYGVTVSLDKRTAVVTETWVGGVRTLATLVCQVPSPQHHGGFDQENEALFCSGAGYTFSLTTGGVAGITKGRLSKIVQTAPQVFGARLLATSVCSFNQENNLQNNGTLQLGRQ